MKIGQNVIEACGGQKRKRERKGQQEKRPVGWEWLDDYEAMRNELAEGGGWGPTTLTFGNYGWGKGKVASGAILMDVQGDMGLGDFYDGLMDYAKKCGLPSVPIERVQGSFMYGSSKECYLFYELSYDSDEDVIETMRKGAAAKCEIWLQTPEQMSKEIVDTAKELKARIGRKA